MIIEIREFEIGTADRVEVIRLTEAGGHFQPGGVVLRVNHFDEHQIGAIEVGVGFVIDRQEVLIAGRLAVVEHNGLLEQLLNLNFIVFLFRAVSI